jgi:hypothetical protein
METDTTVLDIQKRYGSRAMTLSICIALLFVLLGYKDVCRGLVLGGLFSTLNFVLMGQFLRYRLDNNRKSGTKKALIALLIRYVILAIPIVISVRSNKYNLPATVVGIFMVQLVIMIENGSRLLFASFKH